MASIKDLEPCNYFPVDCEALTAIGWLGRGVEFARGEVSGSFFAKLASLCSLPWQPLVFAGSHRCDLCQFDGPQFSANLFVPHGGRIYVAPVAITHYIAAHWYHPPDIFIRAVLECPAMSSMEYKKAILANGGRSLARPP